MAVIKSTICYQSGEVRIRGIQCRPENDGAYPGVVVFHGMEGFQAHHECFSQEIARAGDVVLTPQSSSIVLPAAQGIV